MSESLMALTPKQQRFVEEYLVDLNATQAAIRAGYSERTANEQGARLLANASVAAAIAEAQAARSARTEITQDVVLQRLWQIATADANDLVEFRRTCCRHCWGVGHDYQRTDRELAKLAAEWGKAKMQGEAVEDIDTSGGNGWDPRRDPHPDCPVCFGEGQGDVMVKDTRKLNAAGRALYNGVKVTKEGVQIAVKDPMQALQLVGRHMGMFKDRTEVSGPDGSPLQVIIKKPDDASD